MKLYVISSKAASRIMLNDGKGKCHAFRSVSNCRRIKSFTVKRLSYTKHIFAQYATN